MRNAYSNFVASILNDATKATVGNFRAEVTPEDKTLPRNAAKFTFVNDAGDTFVLRARLTAMRDGDKIPARFARVSKHENGAVKTTYGAYSADEIASFIEACNVAFIRVAKASLKNPKLTIAIPAGNGAMAVIDAYLDVKSCRSAEEAPRSQSSADYIAQDFEDIDF